MTVHAPRAPRRPRQSLRALGLNPRALGLSQRQLRTLTAEQIAERLQAAAEAARCRPLEPVAAPAPGSSRTIPSLGQPKPQPGCSACHGTGWVEAGNNAVTECECRWGVTT